MSGRISIRASTYRGQRGFTVNAGHGRNIFCTTREQADAYKALLQAELPFEEHCARSHEILCGGAQ